MFTGRKIIPGVGSDEAPKPETPEPPPAEESKPETEAPKAKTEGNKTIFKTVAADREEVGKGYTNFKSHGRETLSSGWATIKDIGKIVGNSARMLPDALWERKRGIGITAGTLAFIFAIGAAQEELDAPGAKDLYNWGKSWFVDDSAPAPGPGGTGSP